jgi:hypothetical protein
VHEEHAFSTDCSGPMLARLLYGIAAGDTLVVVRLDRLARSVSHLLAVIEQLAAKGAYFRSLRDPIDTTTPQGMFSLQVLGAVAHDAESGVMQSDPTGTQESPRLRRRSAPHNLRPQRGLSVRAALPS